MNTILVSGNDTGIGKTHVTGLLARTLASLGSHVQVVKPVQTGTETGEPGDAETAAAGCVGQVTPFTLFSYRKPLAPLAAARHEGASFGLGPILRGLVKLPLCDWRLIEGAGGLAVPIDEDGSDWADLARELGVQACVFVVEDRLGAINQARMLLSHGFLRSAPRPLLVFNSPRPVHPDVASSNLEGLFGCGLPVLRLADAGGEGLLRALQGRILDEGTVCCR